MGNHHPRYKHHHHHQRGPPFPVPPIPTAQSQNTVSTQMGLVLPYDQVDSSLRALAGEAEGFGGSSIGGRDGHIYQVINLNDDGPGSLRDGCRKKEPLWIVFEVSGTIELRSYLSVSSYKTIDGRGQRIKITGKGLRLKECEHVIICNIEFEGGRGPDVDAIQIKPKSRHIWIDRCSLSDYDDGLIDITRESTDITVSRCHFSKHDKTMLIGGDPSNCTDRCMRVTIHHCFFDGTRQRHPRVRFGKVHLYNNYTRNWGIYAVCASVESQIYSQCNIYEAGQKKVAFKYLTEKWCSRCTQILGPPPNYHTHQKEKNGKEKEAPHFKIWHMAFWWLSSLCQPADRAPLRSLNRQLTRRKDALVALNLKMTCLFVELRLVYCLLAVEITSSIHRNSTKPGLLNVRVMLSNTTFNTVQDGSLSLGQIDQPISC